MLKFLLNALAWVRAAFLHLMMFANENDWTHLAVRSAAAAQRERRERRFDCGKPAK